MCGTQENRIPRLDVEARCGERAFEIGRLDELREACQIKKNPDARKP
jgi:hypothetical protein